MTRRNSLMVIAIIGCVVMSIVDAVIQPDYAVKSAIKIVVFLALPIFYAMWDKSVDLKAFLLPKKEGILLAIGLGVGIYVLIVGAYLLLENVFDFSAVTTTLEDTIEVDAGNFVWVAIYISFANSLLEEFFFRGFAFLSLKKVSSRKFAYCFSALIFSLYHIAMMIGWFEVELILLVIVGLFVGGLIFNFFNEKTGNIYISWLVHMCANFAINTVGFILFGMI